MNERGAYNSNVNLHSPSHTDQPCVPSRVPGADCVLPDIVRPHRADNVDRDAQSENGNHGKALATGQFESPYQWHWHDGGQKIREQINHARRKNQFVSIQTVVWVIRGQVERCFDRAVSCKSKEEKVKIGVYVHAVQKGNKNKSQRQQCQKHHGRNQAVIQAAKGAVNGTAQNTTAEPQKRDLGQRGSQRKGDLEQHAALERVGHPCQRDVPDMPVPAISSVGQGRYSAHGDGRQLRYQSVTILWSQLRLELTKARMAKTSSKPGVAVIHTLVYTRSEVTINEIDESRALATNKPEPRVTGST